MLTNNHIFLLRMVFVPFVSLARKLLYKSISPTLDTEADTGLISKILDTKRNW